MNWRYLILLVWQPLLGVCSAKRRHQSPEWTILSHIDCLIGEVNFQVLLDSLYPCSTRVSWRSPPVLQGGAVKVFLESVSSGIHAMWPNGETLCLDNSQKVWLLGCPSHLIMVPFDSWQLFAYTIDDIIGINFSVKFQRFRLSTR